MRNTKHTNGTDEASNFNTVLQNPRDTQIYFKDRYLHRDPWGGSYYVEKQLMI